MLDPDPSGGTPIAATFEQRAAVPAGTGPYLLQDARIHDRAALVRLVEAIHADGGTYHRLHLTPDLCIEGDYDMRRYVDLYGIPDDLAGLKVLDVGTAAGYFALECARRGGEVVAIDVWDSTPVQAIARCADVPISYVTKSIYDLDRGFGEFDLVVCGSLLLHLPDLFGAVSALRRVCRGRLCVSTACPPDSGTSERPTCDFLGQRGEDGNYYSYWDVSAAALRRMLLLTGFARLDHERHFLLESNEGRHPFAVPHVVMTARV
jgi:SAM-dependent methyltransferase